jgi:hypothetical protein
MTWLRKQWVQSVGYWGIVGALMFADGDLSWDDILIFVVALWGYFKLIFRTTP